MLILDDERRVQIVLATDLLELPPEIVEKVWGMLAHRRIESRLEFGQDGEDRLVGAPPAS